MGKARSGRAVVVAALLAGGLVGCETPPAPAAAPGATGRAPRVEAQACPEGGVRIVEGQGDAAMGLRVGRLELVNCAAAPYRLEGFPEVRVLDADARQAEVSVVHGSAGITTGVTGMDQPPQPVVLMPGEAASFPLLWRNTVTDGTTVDGRYVEVVPRPGAPALRLKLVEPLDLGTTGKLGIGPWQGARTAP
ncbi:DUF4232 domain-containing protein [Streptomyces sp. NPDC059917]|uniref:DUF4232 domain-containing protein n=1 Tax=Streptomyces sp. NPDC059917 TaxID=3347002 RepID=UPI003652BB58